MPNWNNLTSKVIQTVEADGILGLGKRGGRYLKKRFGALAKKESEPVFKDVLFIDGCGTVLPHPSRYRVSHQREQLLSYGITSDQVYFADLDLKQIGWYNVFVFFRCPLNETTEKFVKLAKKYQKTVLYDIDDLVFDTKYTDTIPYVTALEKKEREAYDENVRAYGQLLDLCQGAVTTTGELSEALKLHVKEVCINRNRASEEMMQISETALNQKTEHKEVVRLGYFSGSITHNPDIEMLLPVLLKLMRQYKNLEFASVGELEIPEELKEFADRIKILPFVDWKNLPKLISDVDINLAPLEDTIFNRAKSENKWVEASLVQVVTVASNLGAFADTIENQKTGFLCKDLKEWEETLCALIEQPRLRRKIAMQAYQFCKEAYLTTYTGKTLADFIKAKRTKNVGILLPALNISGGIMVAMWHAVFLREAGFDVTILSENTTETSCVFENQNFPVIPLREDAVSGHFDKMIATMWVTVKWLELFSNIDKKYYLVQNYETDFYEKGSPYRAMANATYCKNQIQYVTISKWCKEWLKERFEKECAYAPNGLDTRVFTPCARDFSGKIRILIEGDCGAWHKNVDESFQIVEKLDREKFEIWYLSYNSEPKEWYKPDRFLHKVPFQTVSEVYKQCHILVKSSILESFSYPPLEMMATGGLAVVRPNSGNKEYLRDGENCLLYEPENISEAVEKIMELAENETLRRHLTEGGLKTARQREWETVKQQILNLYLEAGE